jgi:ATP-dependent Clp protease ATP-binding subunit ClpB
MTSNLRSEDELRATFRPEFLNRIDEIVLFQPLTREQLAEIVELQLRRLEDRLAERGIHIELTGAAKEFLAEAGWDPTYGARPLKRALQRLVENQLAMRLLDGEFGDGDTIRVDVADGELTFEKVEVATAEPVAVSS